MSICYPLDPTKEGRRNESSKVHCFNCSKYKRSTRGSLSLTLATLIKRRGYFALCFYVVFLVEGDHWTIAGYPTGGQGVPPTSLRCLTNAFLYVRYQCQGKSDEMENLACIYREW